MPYIDAFVGLCTLPQARAAALLNCIDGVDESQPLGVIDRFHRNVLARCIPAPFTHLVVVGGSRNGGSGGAFCLCGVEKLS